MQFLFLISRTRRKKIHQKNARFFFSREGNKINRTLRNLILAIFLFFSLFHSCYKKLWEKKKKSCSGYIYIFRKEREKTKNKKNKATNQEEEKKVNYHTKEINKNKKTEKVNHRKEFFLFIIIYQQSISQQLRRQARNTEYHSTFSVHNARFRPR